MMAALRNKRFLVFGGAAALCLLFLVGSVVVHLRQYYSLRVAQVAANQQLAELKQAVEGVDSAKLEAENQTLGDDLSDIERSLPEREYVPTLMRQIESGAALTHNDLVELQQGDIERGLTIGAGGAAGEPAAGGQSGAEGKAGETSPGGAPAGGQAAQGGAAPTPEGTGQRYSRMGIEVRLSGSYVGAFEFMRHLGSIGKIIAVDGIEVERAVGTEKRPDGRATAGIKLDCKAYILEPLSGFPGEVTVRVL
jgi:Tfp pilus assembly protein PilO